MNNIKNKFSQFKYNAARNMQTFMTGRYGVDDLYKFLNVIVWILIVLQLFVRKPYILIAVIVLICINYFRAFSKNYSKRYNENQLYLKYTKGIRDFFKLQIRKFKEIKNYRFRKCPNCKKVLRLPNKKGKHTVSCPNCHKSFEVRI